MNKYDFQQLKTEAKKTLALSSPMLLAQMVYATSGFISTAMIAHLGEAALSANVLVWTLWFALIIFFFGVLSAISILVSHQHGAQNSDAIRSIMKQGYIFGLIAGIIMAVILQGAPFFLSWTDHTSPEVLQLADQLIHSLLWTIPGLLALFITQQFLTGMGEPKLILITGILIVPIEIFLIYVLIFGKLGLPALGIAGIGYGLSITYALSAIGTILYLSYSKKQDAFKLFKRSQKKQINYAIELLRVGLPIGLIATIEMATLTILTYAIADFGTTALAAHQLVMQYFTIAILFITAMSQAVSIRIGHAVGKNNLLSARQSVTVGLWLNFLIMLFISGMLHFFPTLFLRIDMNIHATTNQVLVHQASQLLSICAILLIFENFRMISFGSLRGLKDIYFPLYTSLICFLGIGLGLGWLLAFHFNLKAIGIWIGLATSILIAALVLFYRLRYILKHADFKKILQAHLEN